ncbi:IPT/TIG domain-containing protein [Solirubrobacter soli]|uniref:IPT/TIG domain-containing protein n=1 Tax=Solirubrobacter soli TaxID=363832 RepID=UPI0004231844|nr:IPT/TIG domain-containing protein [Solirubrobacter soli]
MVLRPRTRPLLRRAVAAAALGALLVPATAGAKAKAPVITKVTPKTAAVGTKLTIQGKNFTRGKGKNSVLFRRDKGKALFVKADVSTTKQLVVVVPKTLEKYMNAQGNLPIPTRFRLRVLSAKLSKAYTREGISPVIGPEKANGGGDNSGGAGVPTAPDGDCDSDGVKNSVDLDDDNDLLSDALELSLLLDPCVGDTDGDGVEDGFEYQSAIDLNNDDYQHPNYSIPYPTKTAYPNPLFKDADKDYDGDGLDLGEEYKLWKYTYEVNHTAARTLTPLSYSDGLQYSLSVLAGGNGRHTPTMNVTDYQPPQAFRSWADSTGYGQVFLRPYGATRDLYDMDGGGSVTTVPTGNQERAELTYWDLDFDGKVSDDERDEDADGLTNYDEVNGPMTAGWWKACYPEDGEYPIPYVGTKAYDADSDGDGILDGADDQDFDDIPNIMELSRNMAGNWPRNGNCGGRAVSDPAAPFKTYVNPFNPCLPDIYSRTCQRHPSMSAAYAPFIDQWEPKIRN